jgi:putative SOS response-associated peptidase YedK
LVGAARNVEPRYNIAPTTTIDVVVKRDAGRELVRIASRWKKTDRRLAAVVTDLSC